MKSIFGASLAALFAFALVFSMADAQGLLDQVKGGAQYEYQGGAVPGLLEQAKQSPAAGQAAQAQLQQVTTGSSASSYSGSGGGCSNLATEGLRGVVRCVISLMETAVSLIMAAAVLYIVWGAFQMMREEKRDEGKQIIYHGLIGLFVMISIWGLVNILDSTFKLRGSPLPPPQFTR